ncbi:unnamed protein product [Didymodactylos carnosus]|uniref:Integrase catalytic domain-containing protein n=1 Tax=Didymodactylos carnosus TaxID=1234261 RepID=A0A815ZAU6_9BILA|nr:unnamed protein product [Didymodactylos carnosus]CAF4449437.1 unnamed protein product [Didymodactylos carnosus]
MHIWATFLRELRATFSSSFSKEAAIKQIGNRQQRIDETVLHYYTDMMELANRIDHQMNGELKVVYLTTGLKISLKKEVLRNKPQTPAEFTKYAQDEEKLGSSITTQISNDNRLTIPIDYVAPSVRIDNGRAAPTIGWPFMVHKNRYVLCIIDHFSKWVTAIALPNCTAQTTAETLYNEYICMFGVPSVI